MNSSLRLLDCMKLWMACVVVAIHTNPESSLHNLVFEKLANRFYELAVPFFFMASGFLVWHKIVNADTEKKKDRLKGWIRKTFRLYMVWTAIYLPFTLYGFWHDGVSLTKSIVAFARNVCLVGQNYLSWPLWYLLGMLVAGCIVYLLTKWGFKNKVLYFVALAFAIGGVCLNYCQDNGIAPSITGIYFKLFQTTRNGFFEGLPYITLGIAVASGHKVKSKALLAILFIGSFVLHMMGLKLATYVTVYVLFCLVIQFDLPNRNDSLYANCRLTSTIVYFVHMIWVGILTLLLPFEMSTLWLFVAVLLLSFATAAVVIRNKENRIIKYCFR